MVSRRIVICDDERKICQMLEDKIKKLVPQAEIKSFFSGKELLSAKEEPDILLLDIGMPEMDGMTVAKALRDKGWRKILIFFTGEEGYVFQAFDVNAFHYLVKPVSDEKLQMVLESARASLQDMENDATCMKQERFVTIKVGGSNIRINLSEIRYAEVYDRKTIIHTTKEDIEYYGRLSSLEKLVGKEFFRVHRSYLVHLKFVEKYNGLFVCVTGGDEMPIARRNYQEFVKSYLNYCRRMGLIS